MELSAEHRRLRVGAAVAALTLALLTSCAPGPPAAEEEREVRLPHWVKVVTPVRDGRAYFVGGVSYAADADEGVIEAEADAESQIHLEAVDRFNLLLARAVSVSDIETTGLERMQFRSDVSDEYALRLVAAARRDSVYVGSCGPSEFKETEEARRPVCNVFVMVSINEQDWDRVLTDVLTAEKAKLREKGEQNLSRLAEWLVREVGSQASGKSSE